MSGHDNSVSGHDLQFGPAPGQTWEDFFTISDEDMAWALANDIFDFDAQSQDNTLPSVAVQEGPTLDQGNDLSINTALPAQAIDAQPTSNALVAGPNDEGLSPIDFGMGSDNIPEVVNNTWTAIGVDRPILPQLYPPTNSQGECPAPRQQWQVLERTVFQQGSQSLTGAGAIDSGSNFQGFAAGNHASNAVGHGFPLHQAPSDGAANSSIPHPAAPVRLQTPAPKPASDIGAIAPTNQVSADDAKLAPPPVALKKKETKAKQTAARNRPTTSKAKQPAVKFPIDNSKVLVTSLDAAKQIAITRVELEVVNDDHVHVAANIGEWTLKVAKAIEVDFRTQAEDHERLTEEGRTEFTRWQKEHENRAWDAIKEASNPSEFVQACALIFCMRVLEAHQLGSLEDPGKAVENNNSDVDMKCSERINAAINAIEEYSIVKYDLLKLERLEPLLANPMAFCSRKSSNMWVNYKKKPGSGPVKLAVDGKDSLAAPKAKSQSKRKRNAPSSPASEDEGEDESDGEFVETSKRTRRT